MNQKFQFMIFTLEDDSFIVWPSSVTWPSTCLNKLFQLNNCAKLFWNPCINVEVKARRSSIRPFYHDLQVWPWSSKYLTKCIKWHFYSSRTNCAKLFWNPCINIEVMARTSSIHDHFIIWPPVVTLTFNISEQVFQIAFLLLKEITSAKLLRNPCINVQVMAQTNPVV